MTGRQVARVRRLLGDLRRGETRGDAVRRVRRRFASTVGRGRAGGSADQPASTPGAESTRRPDAWYVGEWGRLASAVLGADERLAAADAPRAGEAVAAAHRQRAQAAMAQALAEGGPLERAVCRAVAELCAGAEWNPAWALAEGVAAHPGGAAASALGHAIRLHRHGQRARAWAALRSLDDAILAGFAPVEAVDGALADGSPEARRRALAIAAPRPQMDAPTLVDLAGRLLAIGERPGAAALVAELRGRPSVALDERRRFAWRLIEGWLDPRPADGPAGAIPVGVLDYRSPDHVLTSGNLGDYIQTLGMLANLVRMPRVAFTGEGGLGELAAELQARVQPGLRDPAPSGAVHLVPVDRDFSSGASVPPGTWLLAFGWHMHSLFELRSDFPYHPNVRPLFVSFHVNRLEMLTEEALAYLRRNGPVGCRDWNTVFLLLGAGVDAFFSGCFTTTLDAVFPPRESVHRPTGVVGVIDRPPHAAGRGAKDVRVYRHQSDDYRYMSLAAGLRAAEAAVGGYQRDLDRAATGRLHAYLPLTAVGVPVDFQPSLPGDVRFAGLLDLHPGDLRLEELRTGIRDLVGRVFATILSGADEDAVRGQWRELTRERVAEARARFAEPVADAPTSIDIAAAVATCRAGSRRFGPHERVDPDTVTDVVVAFDANLTWPAAVLLESIVANASGPVRLWVLARGLPSAYPDWLATAFPSVPITFVPCDRLTYGPKGRPRRVPARITISTMDRLILPELLDEVDRVVYLDVDTLVIGDVCQLARVDLGGHPIAARDANVTESSEWWRAGRALEEPLATELRRRYSARDGFGRPALNAGVLVLDLARMRRDGFTAVAMALVEKYGLHDQDTLLAYAGRDRAVLDPRWNALPILEEVHDPALIHWASLDKPWDERLSFEKECWRSYAARVRDRAGDPPVGDEPAPGPEGSLHNPVPVGPATGRLAPEVERVIEKVRAEHLSYLDETSLRTLAATVAALEADRIEGVIVEAGTALGGSAITLAAAKRPDRPMRVYDVFGMIPPPGEKDGPDVHRRYATIASGASTGIAGDTYYGYRSDLLESVTAAFERHGLPLGDNRVDLVPGLFQDTLVLDVPVALAHLDGDWYASTLTCLARIAPRLAPGGRIVLDDYDTWSGCRVAVHEYFAGRPGFRFERRGRLHVIREGNA